MGEPTSIWLLYPELLKTIFPHKFSISLETPQWQFTAALDIKRMKYHLIKFQEYQHPIWIMDRLAGVIYQRKAHTYNFKCSIYALVEQLTLPTTYRQTMAAAKGLGENSNTKFYYTAMSNTTVVNTKSNFVNKPYGGIHLL